jgi:hypothetical protein
MASPGSHQGERVHHHQLLCKPQPLLDQLPELLREELLREELLRDELLRDELLLEPLRTEDLAPERRPASASCGTAMLTSQAHITNHNADFGMAMNIAQRLTAPRLATTRRPSVAFA